MNTGVKITAFVATLAATFGAAYGLGTAAGPVEESAKPAHTEHAAPAKEREGGHSAHEEAARGPVAGGLQVSEGGYTLALETPRITAGRSVVAFSVKDGSGRKVTAYKTEHGKELHLVVASRDLTVYRHLHPVRAADGTWSTPVDLPAAGAYKAFADFTPAAKGAGNVTLGVDLAVAGTYAPRPLPAAARTARVDGYQVTLDGTLTPGRPGRLKLTVSKDGRPVTDLQPYLGAYGHLVALRAGDLAYLHVHPDKGRPGPEVAFTATAPSAGAYRLFLDFRHQGQVRTAAFTVHAGGHGAAPETPDGHTH